MNKTHLFLDDIRDPIHAYGYTKFPLFISCDWVIVRSYDDFVNHIKSNGLPYFIAFDHDLMDSHYSIGSFWDDEVALQEKTGMDCAKWLVEYCMDNNIILPEYYVHSMNPVGKRNIESLLVNYKKSYEKF